MTSSLNAGVIGLVLPAYWCMVGESFTFLV